MYLNKSLPSRVLALSASFALCGCDWVVMKPHGDIAQQQAQLIVTSTLLMLLIIVPVIAPSAMMISSGAPQITSSSRVEWSQSGAYVASALDCR